MNFYAEFKDRNDSFNNGFINGMLLVGSESVKACKVISETADKTVYETKNNCIIECYHKIRNNVIECCNIFKNNSDDTVTLDMLSSFAISGLTADKIHRATSFWSAEGKLLTQDITELNMEKAWSSSGIRFEKFGQVGSMPVRKWFPFLCLENSEKSEFIGVQLYCASSWQIEIFRNTDTINICGGLADFDFGHWCKNILPNESFETPKAVIATGSSLEEVCDKLVKAQNPRIAKCDRDMPVIFNEYCTTWGNPTIENLEKIAARLDGSGIKYLVIDSGWYKDSTGDWWNCVGDWNVNSDLFPNGLKEVSDMIKSHGLIPGIWFEFESIGEKSAGYNKYDDVLKRFGSPITVGNRRFWDMRKQNVIDYLSEKVIGLLRDNDFGYLKVDYNENIGVGCDGAESLGEGLRQAVCATQGFFKKITDELPDLVIENCSSGGHRLEPSMMELTSQSSFSDAHECKSIPIIAANLHRLIRAEQSQIWAVMRKNDDIHRINYSLTAGFLGRLCLSGDIFDLTEESWENVKAAVSFYDKIKDIIRDGFTSIIKCTSKSYNDLTGYQAVLREKGSKALLIVHTFSGGANPPINEILNKYNIIDSFGSNLDGDYRGKAFLISKK